MIRACWAGLRAVGTSSREGVGGPGEGESEAGEGPGLDDSASGQNRTGRGGLRDRWPIPGAQEPRASVGTLVKGDQAMSGVQGPVATQGRRRSSLGGREGFLDPKG